MKADRPRTRASAGHTNCVALGTVAITFAAGNEGAQARWVVILTGSMEVKWALPFSATYCRSKPSAFLGHRSDSGV